MVRLAPGLRADFLVLDANPLEDVRHTRRISAVYRNGSGTDRDAIRDRLIAAGSGPGSP